MEPNPAPYIQKAYMKIISFETFKVERLLCPSYSKPPTLEKFFLSGLQKLLQLILYLASLQF